jgi:hypothetical protein
VLLAPVVVALVVHLVDAAVHGQGPTVGSFPAWDWILLVVAIVYFFVGRWYFRLRDRGAG